jgi:hypothetical protein
MSHAQASPARASRERSPSRSRAKAELRWSHFSSGCTGT